MLHLCAVFQLEVPFLFWTKSIQWMQEKKAEQVRAMIINPEISFQEIVAEFGFSSPSHFTSYCRRLFGVPPSQLREESNANKQT